VIISGRPKRLKPRGSVDVPRGAWHRIENPGRVPVVLIEVQHGPYLGEDDIIRRQDDYGRAGLTTTTTTKAKGGNKSRKRGSKR
jgi:oxalate decarboxylase/phosphoglucose isomerase-like protein (cupin superfamily)